MNHATGSFEVKITPQIFHRPEAALSLGRMSIDKRFSGDLDAASIGEMLTGGDMTKGSAGYVAMELVTGKLGEREGSFVLQHTGSMNRGVPQLTVSVVPDSGTGQLAGLSGTMNINIVDKKHFYEFAYTLPDAD